MNKLPAKIIIIIIVALSAWVLVSREYLNYGSQRRAEFDQARKTANQSLMPAVVKIAQDLGISEKTGKFAPKSSPGYLLLQQKTGEKITQIEYGLTSERDLYRKTNRRKEILAHGVLQFWMAPGPAPLSWSLNLTADLKIRGQSEPAIFNYYFAPNALNHQSPGR